MEKQKDNPGGPNAAWVVIAGHKSDEAWGEGTTPPIKNEKPSRIMKTLSATIIWVLDKVNILDRRTYGHP